MARKRKNVKSKSGKRHPQSLETIQPNAAGVDLGSREHWVAGPPLEDAKPNVERFGTTIEHLLTRFLPRRDVTEEEVIFQLEQRHIQRQKAIDSHTRRQ